MVNVNNINRVIEAIRNEDNFFNMLDFKVSDYLKTVMRRIGQTVSANCGTPACICGWTNYLNGTSLMDAESAADFLGIDNKSAGRLFVPYERISLERITRKDAIATLEHLRDTGEVRWSVQFSNDY